MIEQEIYNKLLKQFLQKDEALAQKEIKISELTTQVLDLVDQMKILSDKIDYLTTRLYGAKSEKSRLPKNNLATTAESVKKISDITESHGTSSTVNVPCVNEPLTHSPIPSKRYTVERRTYEEIKEEINDVPLLDCPEGAIFLRYEDTTRLVYVPGKIKRVIWRRPIYVLGDKFYTPGLPECPLDKCYADASLLATIITNKYRFHLPLERQLTMFKSLGIDIAKSTFNNWATKSIDLLNPLHDALLKIIRKSEYVNIDETTIKVVIKELSECKNAYLWGLTAKFEKLALFYYDDGSRSQATLLKIIGGAFNGAIQSDACPSYKILESKDYIHKIITLSCLAHIRRKIFESISTDNRAQELFDLINCIYHYEHLWQKENEEREKRKEPKLNYDEISHIRKRDEYPIMLKLYRKLQTYNIDKSVLPKSSFGKAVRYALNEASGILRCLKDGRYALDNNNQERQFKDIILGRKNYLFCQGHLSAKRTATIYSLIACCKLNDVDPYDYLTNVLQRISSHNQLMIEELLPHKWKKNTE